MDEFERSVLSKFPDFPGYRTGEVAPEAAQQWYTAYQSLVEWLHGRRGDVTMIRQARERVGSANTPDS